MAKVQREDRQIALGDNYKAEEFSSSTCVCYGTRLAGQRHHCLILK